MPETKRRGRPRSGAREAILAATEELLRERGAARLTTREVAERAGVSEGSVFYHFRDRTGLLTAVLEDALGGLATFYAGDGTDGTDGAATFPDFVAGLPAFLDRVVLAMTAASSDADLRAGVVDFLERNDLGPHRGVEALADHLAAQQAAGVIRKGVDPRAVATLLIGAVFTNAGIRQMISPAYAEKLPPVPELLATLAELLRP